VGTLYEGIDITNTSAILYNMIFIGRRLFFAAVIVFCSWFPAFQVQTILWTSMGTVVYSAAVRPFTDMSMNYLDVLNEATIMFVAYATIPYSDYLLDPYFKYDIGWLLISVFFTTFAINIGFILVKAFLNMFRKIKQLTMKKKSKVQK